MKSFRYILLPTLCALLLSSACDSTLISPFSGRDVHYSIYGYLAPSDTHLVRIAPVRNRLERDDVPVSLDVQVSSVETRSGRTNTWTQVIPLRDDGDRGLQFSDSTFGHVFQAIFPITPGEEYQLSISDVTSDVTTVETTIPEIRPPVPGNYIVDGGVKQQLFVPDLFHQPFKVESTYFLVSPIFNQDRYGFIISSENRGVIGEDGLTIELNLSAELATMRRIIIDNLSQYSDIPVLEDPQNFPLIFNERSIRVQAGDSTWSMLTAHPDRSLLSQPGAASNVRNGFGFFGGLGLGFTEASDIPDTFLSQAGYAN